jgi:anti-anti-sigma factor
MGPIAKNVQFLAAASSGRSWIMIDTDCSWQTPLGSSATPAITVTLSRHLCETTVCTVVGAVDWNTRTLLRNALAEAGQDDNVHLVIDLSAVTSMDSAGPYTLLEARFKHGLRGRGHLAVVADPRSTAIPELQDVAIRAAFDVHPTLSDALHACAHVDTRAVTAH